MIKDMISKDMISMASTPEDMILAKFEKTIKVSINSWRVVWVEKLFEETHTILDIINWAEANGGDTKVKLGGIIITKPDAVANNTYKDSTTYAPEKPIKEDNTLNKYVKKQF